MHISFGAVLAPRIRRERGVGEQAYSSLKRCIRAALLLAAMALPSWHAGAAEPIDLLPWGGVYWLPFNRTVITPPMAPGWTDHRDAQPPGARSEDRTALDLSPAVRRVSRIADWNGDRLYVVIDKTRGKLILFEDGRPVLIRPALTGENLSDELPPDAVGKSVHEQKGIKYKVTPAGRFTLNHAYERGLGRLLDINEIRGKDWGLAIHQVWLGNRSEHRDDRLRSVNGQDTHITTGCIDVDADTMRELLRLVPRDGGTPIYILPTDENLIATLFRPRTIVAGPRVTGLAPLWPARFAPRPIRVRNSTFLQ